MSSPTYDKCYYFVVKARGLADDEEKKFNHTYKDKILLCP